MKEAKELTKGAVRAMLKDVAAEQGKSHVLQLCPVKGAPEAGKKAFMYFVL